MEVRSGRRFPAILPTTAKCYLWRNPYRIPLRLTSRSHLYSLSPALAGELFGSGNHFKVPIQLTDSEIAALLVEPKSLPDNYSEKLQLRSKRGHRERELEITGAQGSEFRLILRQSNFNPLDFSAILGYRPPKSTQVFRLCRYNGRSHEHTNKLEKQKFYDFHIHRATERYQLESGEREDGYAEPTSRYADFNGALDAMLDDCGFSKPDDLQALLF